MRSHNSYDWTPAAIAQLRDCFEQGMTSTQIGMKLGLSRNAVIGKCTRLGLKRGRKVTAVRAKVERTVAQNVTVKRVAYNRANVITVPVMAKVEKVKRPSVSPILTLADAPRTGKIRIYEIGNGCRWPIDTDKDGHLFCGLPRAGESYCEAHQVKSIHPHWRKK